MSGKPTYREVARRANVSPATVSRIARGNARVSPEISDRVQKAAEQLGIQLKRRKRPQVLAFVLSNRNMLNRFHAQILTGAEESCAEVGCNMLYLRFSYSPSTPWRQIQLPHAVEHYGTVDAFILAGCNSENLLELLTAEGMPFVVLGSHVIAGWHPDKYTAVWFDDVRGATEMTRYLLSLGHKSIWYVGNTRLPWYARRYEGYCLAMREAGLPPHLAESVANDDLDIGYLATKALLGNSEPLSAIFAGGDRAVLGTYRALREFGLRIPDDVSVAGFDDTEGVQCHPPLTSMRVYAREIGKHLVELARRQMEHPGQAPQHMTVPTELVKRESCRSISTAQGAAGEKGSETADWTLPTVRSA